MSEEERASYYAIIPANVRYDPNLPPNAKLLYGEITALCNKHGYCWASNNYFANLYNVYPTTISKWLKKLKDKGYITLEIIYKDKTKEIENRFIKIIDTPIVNLNNTYCSKEQEGINQKSNTPIVQKNNDNNTYINNTSNKKKESKKEEETFDTIICSMINNDELKELTYEFIKMRKLIKAPLTNQALKMMVKKLYQIGATDEDRIEILSNSIMNNWKGIFPLKQQTQQVVRHAPNEPIECNDPDFLKEKEELQRTLRQSYGHRETAMERANRLMDKAIKEMEEEERKEMENDKK